MANPLYNMINNAVRPTQPQPQQNNNPLNLLAQIRQIQQNPGMLLDMMLQNGKITQEQYQEMQPIKNDPQKCAQYLFNHGYANELNQAQQQVNNMRGT